MDLDPLLAEHGLKLVFLGTAISGDTVGLAAGVLQQRGVFHFWPTVLAVAAGGVISDVGIFAAGKLFRTSGRVARAVDHPKTQKLMVRLIRYPLALAVLSRFIPGSRTFVPIALAASDRIGWSLYTAAVTCASLVWAWIVVAVGEELGEWITALVGVIRETETILVVPVIAVALSLATFTWQILRKRKRDAEAPRSDNH